MSLADRNQERLADLRAKLEGATRELERLGAADRASLGRRTARAIALAVAFAGIGIFVTAGPVQGTIVAAPFEVFGSHGTHPMMIIGTDPSDEKANVLQLYRGDNMMLKLQASETLSFVSALSADGRAVATLGADETTSYLKLRTALKDRVSLDVTDGKPYVRFKGDDGHGVLEFHEGENGGGELLMAQPGGQVRVKAGASINGVGKVEVWPQDNAYTRGSPVGAFIVGQKGG